MKTNMFSKLKGVVVFFKIKLASCYHELYQNALQRLPITRDLSPSKDSDKAALWWTSIIEKPLKLF